METYVRAVTDTLWSALVDPHRRALLDVLRDGASAVGDLVTALEMSQPMASKHLRVLRDAGLVHVRVEAQRRIYSINPSRLAELDAWLAPYRRLWNERLDALGEHLDEHPEIKET